MKMSGRPSAMFRPEAINQLRMLELVLHFLRQLHLSFNNKECPCSVFDRIARPERELALAIRFRLHVGKRMIWQIELHHAGGHAVVTDQQVRMALLASFLYVLCKVQPTLGSAQWVILQGQPEKDYCMKEDCNHQSQSQRGPCHPAPCWVPR